jgi:hypothetical protein
LLERFAPESLAAPEPPVGPFAFADPARVTAILREAGFAAPDMAPLDFRFVVGEGADPVADALGYFRRIGPLATLLRALEEPARSAATDLLRSIVSAHRQEGRVAFAGAAWIVASHRP